MNAETSKPLLHKPLTIIKEARRLVLEKEYNKASKLYNLATEMLLKLGKASNNEQKKETIKKIIEKMLKEMESVLEIKKSAEEQQKEDNDKGSDINGKLQAKSDLQETFNGDQETFLSRYYPNADDFYVKLFEDLEKIVIEPDTNILLDDIIGLQNDVKTVLREAVILPFQYPHLFTGYRRPWSQILLAGPHMEKMQIIRALAHETKAKLLLLSAPDLFLKWPFDSDKIIKMLFEMGRYYSPTIIYMADIEEIRSLGGEDEESVMKRKTLVEFMVQCQQFQSFTVENERTKTKEFKQPIFIGGSECPWEIDRRLLKRFEKRICLKLPNDEERREIIRLYLQEYNAKLAKDINWEYIIKHTKNYNSNDIASVCREAIMISKRKEIQKSDAKIEESVVFQNDFIEALRKINRSVLDSELANYKTWADEYT